MVEDIDADHGHIPHSIEQRLAQHTVPGIRLEALGDADEADLALVFEALDLGNHVLPQDGIIRRIDAMEMVDIQVIGPQPCQTRLECRGDLISEEQLSGRLIATGAGPDAGGLLAR